MYTQTDSRAPIPERQFWPQPNRRLSDKQGKVGNPNPRSPENCSFARGATHDDELSLALDPVCGAPPALAADSANYVRPLRAE
jgi:hypothetical protein